MGTDHIWGSLLAMTDEQAMWRVQTRDDPQAFAQLVARWEQPIYRLCARMTGDAHRGEDLKQDVFARVFTRRKDFRTDRKFSTWLWRIALNLCYDDLRKTRRRGECALEFAEAEVGEETAAPAAVDPGPDAHLVAQEEGELVRRALLRVDETHRSALVLRYCEGLKLREIAEILELPPTTVSSRIAAGLAQVSRLLQPAFGTAKPRPVPQPVGQENQP